MEEKERYGLFGYFGEICDTNPNAKFRFLNKFQICEILNRQDKEIQQLKQQLKDTEESYNNTTRYLNKIRSKLLNLLSEEQKK